MAAGAVLVSVLLVGLFGIANAIPMGAVMGITATLSLIVMFAVVRPRTVPALDR